MRDYFTTLGDSAHPNSTDPRAKAITNFQELLLVAFREFALITDETILGERRRFRNEIVNSLESFAKRSAVRNLHTMGRFTKNQSGLIYDALYKAICEAPPPPELATVAPPPTLLTTTDAPLDRMETRVGMRTFQVFLSEVATWARDEKIVLNGFQVRMP